jgi:hypothetical protein
MYQAVCVPWCHPMCHATTIEDGKMAKYQDSMTHKSESRGTLPPRESESP